MSRRFTLLVLLVLCTLARSQANEDAPQTRGIGKEPGPWVWPTRGEVWPKPQSIVNFNNEGYMTIHTSTFQFKITRETCDILDEALNRYYNVLLLEREAGVRAALPTTYDNELPKSAQPAGTFRGVLDILEVDLAAPCENMPYFGMDEHYEIRVDSPDLPLAAKLTSQTLQINSTMVSDFPRFPHRGFMLDSVRHFHPLPLIFTLIDGMEASKLNTLHWHITDDQAFPYQSVVFPELSVIEYCRMRGIRIIPEFDSPGHTRSWGESHPELLATCIGEDGQPDGSYGPLDPSKPEVYSFVETLFTEVTNLFPDNYFHLGGDENITDFMDQNNITGNYPKLEELYIAQVINMTESMGSTAILWQEVFDNGLALSNNTIVHTGGNWKELYNCEPYNFTGTLQQKQLILGGEACMWSEYVDGNNVVSRVFPRASAMAERLWSSIDQTDTVEAARRIEEFRCRLVRRGIGAQPANGPGFCPGERF
ncbi:hypothetical protein B566_EDAN016077, partial [Ephemera danica]